MKSLVSIAVVRLDAPDDRYHYRYSGIRMLAHSQDAILLLPVGWQRGRDRVFLVPIDETVRIDVAAR